MTRAAPFRCSSASLTAGDETAGTASTVRAFLLVEAEGAWGAQALDATLVPVEVRAHLRRLERDHRVRPLLIRKQGARHERSGGVRVFAAYTSAERPLLEHAVLDRYDALLDLDLTGLARGRSPGLESHSGPLFCVCTHGRHDACCAERGRPVWEALRRADPEHAWQVSHIGGDRYAANVLVLPEGLYYGRVEPSEAHDLVAAHRDGRMLLDHLRGRTAHPFPVQAGEIRLRQKLGLDAVRDVVLVEHRREGAVTMATFEARGRRHRVRIHTSGGDPRMLTCQAASPHPPLRHDVCLLD